MGQFHVRRSNNHDLMTSVFTTSRKRFCRVFVKKFQKFSFQLKEEHVGMCYNPKSSYVVNPFRKLFPIFTLRGISQERNHGDLQ